MRVQDPFTLDSGKYECVISSLVGDVSSECEVEIEELYDANVYDVIPELVKVPLPAISLLGGSASFCSRVTPIDSDIVWSVCGREISEDMKDYKVSEIIFFSSIAKVNR